MISFFLFPILIGVITLGEKLWLAQKVEPYDLRSVGSEVVGRFSCAELVDRVKTTLVNNSAHLDVPLELQWLVVDVVDVLPTAGAVVRIGISVPASDGLDDPTVTEASHRLENVSLTTETCA